MIKPLLRVAVAAAFLLAALVPACEAQNSARSNAVKKLKTAHKAARYADGSEKALSLLYNLENEIPELKEYVFLIRGDSLAKSGNPLAADMYRIAAELETLKTEALEKQAETLETKGLYGEAEKVYKALFDSETATRKGFYLKKIAESAEKNGRADTATRAWKTLWRDYPASIYSDSAAEKISPSEQDRARRADRLFELNKCVRATAAYATLPETEERNIRQAICLRKTARKNERVLKKALAVLGEAKSARAAYVKGTVLEAMAKIRRKKSGEGKMLRKAQAVFRSVSESFPKTEWTGKALIKEQKIALKLGKTGRAEKIYALVKESHPRNRADAAWNLGWAYYKKEKYLKAARVFAENNRKEKSVLAGQFAYWRARALEKTGARDEAKQFFLKAAKSGVSYYAFLAGEKTGAKNAHRRNAVRGAEKPDSNPPPAIKRASLLLEAGMAQRAENEALSAGYRSPEAACEILAAARKFSSCIKLIGSNPPPERMRLGFPRGFDDEVGRFSSKYGIDKNLVYSLIREESRFKTDAVSHAGAFGLMQLIMPTAKDMARDTGEEEITREKLFSPEVNIKLGARYLHLMLKRFGGDIVAALCAYNAGPSRANRWKNGALKGLEQDEFTEEIPFDETRSYVRRVFRSYGAYRAIYGDL